MSTSAGQRRGLPDIEDAALGIVPYKQWRQNEVYASDLDQFCELKTEYENLLVDQDNRGQTVRRGQPPGNKTFRSRRGNPIEVDHYKHEHSAKIREKGREMHARHASEYSADVQLDIVTQVDATGKLLAQLLAALYSLDSCGLARQVPVFGYIHGVYHSACIDELVRVYNRGTGVYELMVRGYRSRERHEAPYVSDKMLGKVKLMASKELLAGLVLSRLSTNGSISSTTHEDVFARYLRALKVDIHEEFTPMFKADWRKKPEFKALRMSAPPDNIASLLERWDALLLMLGIGEPLLGQGFVSDELELIYLSQPAMPLYMNDVMAPPDPTLPADETLEQARTRTYKLLQAPFRDNIKEIVESLDRDAAEHRRLADATRVDHRTELVIPPSEVLLRHKFPHDRPYFLEVARTSLDYWLGQREPKGAALEGAAWKCDSCEFQKQCEAYNEYCAPKAPKSAQDATRTTKAAKHR